MNYIARCVRQIGKSTLGLIGLQAVKSNRRLHLGSAAEYLASRGIRPTTIIDVGVAWGTDELYRAFPAAALLLIEANEDWRACMQEHIDRTGGEMHICAVGASPGSITLNIWDQHPGSSTTSRVDLDQSRFTTSREVPLNTIDSLTEGKDESYLLKLDIQGAEMHALQGAKKTLERCVAVIVECTLIEKPDVADFSTITAFMLERGFHLADVVGLVYRPSDRALGYVDAVFLPKHHEVRRDRSWVQ